MAAAFSMLYVNGPSENLYLYQNTSSSTMTSLVIVIVNEDVGMFGVAHAPTLVVDAGQSRKVVVPDAFRCLQAVPELGDIPHGIVLVHFDGLAT